MIPTLGREKIPDNSQFNGGNHVVHRPTYLPPVRELQLYGNKVCASPTASLTRTFPELAADLAAAYPARMDPAGSCSIWINYVAVSAGLLVQPLDGFYHDHLVDRGDSVWVTNSQASMAFVKDHRLEETPTTTIGPNHPN